MKYTVQANEKYVVELDRKPALQEEFTAKVDKSERKIRIMDVAKDGAIKNIMVDNRLYSVQVDRRSDGFPEKVTIGGIEYPVMIEKVESRRYRPPMPEKNVDGNVMAELPGQVLKVLVQPGEQVVKGQTVLILEAMKMENEVSSPKDGVIKTIQAPEGKVVMKGDALFSVE
jgi:biotin carboxyl carrier protein